MRRFAFTYPNPDDLNPSIRIVFIMVHYKEICIILLYAFYCGMVYFRIAAAKRRFILHQKQCLNQNDLYPYMYPVKVKCSGQGTFSQSRSWLPFVKIPDYVNEQCKFWSSRNRRFFCSAMSSRPSSGEVDAVVPLSCFTHQLNPNRAEPESDKWWHKLMELCDGNPASVTYSKFFHVKSGRPDEWCMMVPDYCGAIGEYFEPQSCGILAFLRRSQRLGCFKTFWKPCLPSFLANFVFLVFFWPLQERCSPVRKLWHMGNAITYGAFDLQSVRLRDVAGSTKARPGLVPCEGRAVYGSSAF